MIVICALAVVIIAIIGGPAGHKEGQHAHVVEFPAEFAPVRIEIPLGSVAQAGRTLECGEATVAVGLNLCEEPTVPAMK